VVKTAVTATAASVARPGTAVCTDGCTSGTCGNGHVRTFVLAAIIAATALVVANPCMNSASGTVADTGRVVGGAIGDDIALGDATAATAGTTALGEASPASSYLQGMHGHFLLRAFTEEELHEADP
jgi:hypothetical protein